MFIRSVARPIRAVHGVRLLCVFLLAIVWSSCSSGGALPPPTPVPCSATRPCPSGLVCVVARGLCALPADTADLAMTDVDMTAAGDMAPPDLAMTPADMAAPPVDMAMLPADMAMLPADMAMLPADMAMLPADMAMSPADMRIPDMAMPPADMAMPLRDMAMPPADMRMPPDMAMPPPGSEACPAANWCWENPLPQPRDLLAVWGASASDLWTVGARGVALRFDGSTWNQIATGTAQRLRGVWGRSATQVWMVGDAGTIV